MKRSTLTVLALLAVVAPASANLILNGSFEVPPLPSGYDYVRGGRGLITEWRPVFTGVEHLNPPTSPSRSLGTAHDGVLVVDLTPYIYTGGGLEQSVATAATQQYRLTFWGATANSFGRDGTGVIKVTVDADPSQSFNLSNPTAEAVWQSFTLDFTASAASTNIRFWNDEDPYTHFAFLDDINLSPVPEPFTTALGIAALALATKRRRRAKAS